MTTTQRAWTRLAWGLKARLHPRHRYRYPDVDLLFEYWLQEWSPRFDGDMPRPILFASRRQALAWCAAQHARYATRQNGLRDWRFRPVRVLNTVSSAVGREALLRLCSCTDQTPDFDHCRACGGRIARPEEDA